MANSLYPAFVQIRYGGKYGFHTMTLPTREWSPPAGGFTFGSFPQWDTDTARDADDMINDLVDLMLPFFDADSSFLNYTIFTMDDPVAIPQPRIANELALAGTGVAIGYDRSVQNTFTARTEDFGLAKLVLMDSGSFDDFDKVTNLTGFADALALFSNWILDDNAWSGRDGARPATLVSWDRTINSRLEHERDL